MTNPALANSLPIVFADQEMVLLGGHGIWWPGQSSLVIADVHLGKAATFRARGIPVPSGSTLRDLSRITGLLQTTRADRLVILGDLLHARAGRPNELHDEVTRWRNAHTQLDILLIRGNHDRSAGRTPADWRMTEADEPHPYGGLSLLHDPQTPAPAPALAGHVHPVTPLRDFDGSTLNIPSFIADPDRLILPAFGTFTGGYKMTPAPNRRIFLAMAGRVLVYPANSASSPQT